MLNLTDFIITWSIITHLRIMIRVENRIMETCQVFSLPYSNFTHGQLTYQLYRLRTEISCLVPKGFPC